MKTTGRTTSTTAATIAVFTIAALALSCAAMEEPENLRSETMSTTGTLKVITTEYNDDPSMRVDKSVECAVELVDAGTDYDRAEIIVNESAGPVTIPFYFLNGPDAPPIATYNPRSFGDIAITVIAYRAGQEVARWDDGYTLELGSWFLRAMQIEDSVDRQDLLASPNFSTSIGRHDVVSYVEARIPKGQRLMLSIVCTMIADSAPKFPGRVDAHFRLGDYIDRFVRHTGYLEPNRVLDDEPAKWIDGMTGVMELCEGIHKIYIAPSCLGQRTIIKVSYTAGEAHEVGGMLTITARPIDYSIFD